MIVNTELLFKGNNCDNVVKVQEIQALALTVCSILIDKATLHFAPTNYARVSHGFLNNKRLFSKRALTDHSL
jgi:hypothetical protein